MSLSHFKVDLPNCLESPNLARVARNRKSMTPTEFIRPFQIVQSIYALLAAPSIAQIAYFLNVHIWRSTFHQRFKILITIYYGTIFVQQLCYIVSYTILAFERLLATIKHEEYENTDSKCYIMFLIIFTVIIPLLIISWAYRDSDFTSQLVIISITPPAGVKGRLNAIYIFSFFVSITNLMVVLYTRKANRKLLKQIGANLSSKFQVRENTMIAGFVSKVLTLNVMCSSVFTGGTWLLINTQLNGNEKMLTFLRNLLYLSPFNGFFGSLISIRHVSRRKRERVDAARRALMMPSTGRQAADAYTRILNDLWK
ncbi:unnamed protein product [Caenorhabditis bovis]|uniref:Uncharacterized protein n=1 Tax=Caenorhabditis bovis TaxID=2654633 RepID=A0A8S1EYY2_9PELO|nr:unnamed protein product [Caenorhabditis bovis]